MAKLNWDEMKALVAEVDDPDLGVSIVGMGLVYGGEMDDEGKASVRMTLTSPACPAGGYLVEEVRKKLLAHPDVKAAEVAIVWDPKWDPKTMASEEVKEMLGIW